MAYFHYSEKMEEPKRDKFDYKEKLVRIDGSWKVFSFQTETIAFDKSFYTQDDIQFVGEGEKLMINGVEQG